MAQDWARVVDQTRDRLHNTRTISLCRWPSARDRPRDPPTSTPVGATSRGPTGQVATRDLSFATLHPKRYAEIEQMSRPASPSARIPVKSWRRSRQARRVRHQGEVRGRPKHSLEHLRERWSSAARSSTTFSTSWVFASSSTRTRLLGRNRRDSRAVVPGQGRFKDYINSPSSTSISPCTRRDRARASPSRCRSDFEDAPARRVRRRRALGLQARARRARGRLDAASRRRIEEEENDPIAFLEALKLDLGQDEVYVFTPKGRVIGWSKVRRRSTSPTPCTPKSATMRGRQGQRSLVPSIRSALGRRGRDRDQQERLRGPSRDWLAIAQSSRAKSKIASGSSENVVRRD